MDWSLKWSALLFLGSLSNGLYAVLVQMSRIGGKISFDPCSFGFIIESSKLVLSANYYLVTAGDKVRGQLSQLPYIDRLLLCTPAALYMMNNSLSVYMQNEMDPVTFQVLSNLKIIFTALLHKLVLKRAIETNKLLAMLFIFIAGIVHCFALEHIDTSTEEARHTSTPTSTDMFLSSMGLGMILIFCFSSALSSVTMEAIFKRNNEVPLSLLNIHLYGFGVLANLGCFLWNRQGSLFEGYGVYTWTIVASQVYYGLLTAVILKKFGSLGRLLMVSVGLLLSAVCSHLLLQMSVTYFFGLSFLLVTSALSLYTGLVDGAKYLSRLSRWLGVQRKSQSHLYA